MHRPSLVEHYRERNSISGLFHSSLSLASLWLKLKTSIKIVLSPWVIWEFGPLGEWLNHASGRCDRNLWASLPQEGPAATTPGHTQLRAWRALYCVMLVTPGVESKKCNLFHIFNMVILVA